MKERLVVVAVFLLLSFLSIGHYLHYRRLVQLEAQVAAFNATPRRPRATQVRLPDVPISLKGAATKGDINAPVALIQYSDFECPYCGRFAQTTLPAITSEYVDNGKVVLVFKHLPLDFHSRARSAAQAVECAGQQNQFWSMHDRLFAGPLGDETYEEHARGLSLDVDRFRTCLEGPVDKRVEAHADEARSFGITGTPSFFLGANVQGNVRVLRSASGAQSYEFFQKLLDDVLVEVASPSASR